MDKREFVKAITENVRDSALLGTIKNLSKPAGRRPPKEIAMLSQWFNELGESDKDMVKKVITKSIDQSVFGFLAVLDGVRAIEPSLDKGKFELYYSNDNSKQLLNNEQEEYLHDIYNRLISDYDK